MRSLFLMPFTSDSSSHSRKLWPLLCVLRQWKHLSHSNANFLLIFTSGKCQTHTFLRVATIFFIFLCVKRKISLDPTIKL